MNRRTTQGHRLRAHGRGLTLVELAVTLAASAILMGVLMPTTGSVARNRKQAKCLDNLARIGVANTIHAATTSGEPALPVHPAFFDQYESGNIWVGPYEWGGKSGIGETGFVTGTPGDPVNSRYGTQAGFGPATRSLNAILYQQSFSDYTEDPGEGNANWLADTQLELDVYRCPSDVGYTGIHKPAFRDGGLIAYDHFGTSYGANVLMAVTTTGGYMYSNSPFLRCLSDVISPATTLAFQEECGRFAWAARPDPCDFIPGIPGTVAGWHGTDWTFAAAFVDGHADMIYMPSYRLERIANFADGGTYTQYRSIIIRGDGWQKDTLPAELVPTSIYPGEGVWRTSYEGGVE